MSRNTQQSRLESRTWDIIKSRVLSVSRAAEGAAKGRKEAESTRATLWLQVALTALDIGKVKKLTPESMRKLVKRFNKAVYAKVSRRQYGYARKELSIAWNKMTNFRTGAIRVDAAKAYKRSQGKPLATPKVKSYRPKAGQLRRVVNVQARGLTAMLKFIERILAAKKLEQAQKVAKTARESIAKVTKHEAVKVLARLDAKRHAVRSTRKGRK